VSEKLGRKVRISLNDGRDLTDGGLGNPETGPQGKVTGGGGQSGKNQ